MINSITKFEPDKEGKFDSNIFKTRASNEYWLLPKTQQGQKTDSYTESIIPIPVMLPVNAKKTHNVKIIGTSIAGVTILTAATVVFFLKGGPKGLTKNFAKLKDYLEKKIQTSKLEYKQNTANQKIYVYTIQALDKFMKKSEAINNFTTFKDIAFKHIMYTNKFTRKIHDITTKIFEKLCRSTVVNSYNGTKNKFKDTEFAIDELNETILKYKPALTKDIQEADNISNDIMNIYKKYFGSAACQNRYLKVKKDTLSLKKQLNTIKKFFSKDAVNGFMAESIIEKDKYAIQKVVRDNRKELSYTVFNLTSEAEKMLLEITKAVTPKETDKINQIKNIRTLIRQVRKNEKLDNKMKTKIIESLQELQKTTKPDNEIQLTEQSKYLLKTSKELSELFTNYKQGKIEDLLDIYKKILPPEKYKDIKKMYEKNIKSLDNSITIETEKFISKVRDLTLGSAPTDILTILASFITLGYYIVTSDDKQQRQSVFLKYGVPALSGIGVSLYGNAKLFAGTKSLFFGALSMAAVNKIGTWADDKLKQYRSKTDPNSDSNEKDTDLDKENQSKTV